MARTTDYTIELYFRKPEKDKLHVLHFKDDEKMALSYFKTEVNAEDADEVVLRKNGKVLDSFKKGK